MTLLKHDTIEKSSVAQHIFHNNHKVYISNFRLVKNIIRAGYYYIYAFKCIK